MGPRHDRLILGLIIATAAALRFVELSGQSFWYDEALTLAYVSETFGGMLSAVGERDSNPPLYYAVAWVWTRLFGDSEAGLRSLSVVAGVLTVPVTYAAARALAGRRVGLVAALLIAVSPVMVWYSQEARAYALLGLLSALGFMFFVRSLRGDGRRPIVGWAIASALAIATHYFALFAVMVEGLWLLARVRPRRPVMLATAAVGGVGVALLPLALHQRDEKITWITDFSTLGARLEQTARVFTGTGSAPNRTLWVALALAVIPVVVLLRGDATARRALLTAVAVGAGAIAIPVLVALAGSDYVLDRNLLPAVVPLTIAVGTGVALRWSWMLPTALIGLGLCAIYVREDHRIATNEHFQRDDWRAVARELGPRRATRVVVVTPGWQGQALRVYRPGLQAMSASRPVTEVDMLSSPGWGRGLPPELSQERGFALVGHTVVQRIEISRFRATRLIRVPPDALSTPGGHGSRAFVE